VFACIWSIGATSDTDSRVKFDAFLRDLIKGKNTDYPIPDAFGSKLEISFPDNGLVFDYFYHVIIN
jgi:dynein heavy chain